MFVIINITVCHTNNLWKTIRIVSTEINKEWKKLVLLAKEIKKKVTKLKHVWTTPIDNRVYWWFLICFLVFYITCFLVHRYMSPPLFVLSCTYIRANEICVVWWQWQRSIFIVVVWNSFFSLFLFAVRISFILYFIEEKLLLDILLKNAVQFRIDLRQTIFKLSLVWSFGNARKFIIVCWLLLYKTLFFWYSLAVFQ